MKRLWLLLLATALAITTGTALAAAPRNEVAVAKMPTVPDSSYSSRKVVSHQYADWDDGDDDDGGLYFGFDNAWVPGWGPDWNVQPGYYYNPPLIISNTPPPKVYISPQQKGRPYYWYYCNSSHRYYPYVKQCPGGWLKVAPHPPQS